MTKGKWSPFKEMLFTYLAINKIMYWFNTITAMNQADLGNATQAIFMRLLNQDFLIILGVVAFYFLDKFIELKKSKKSKYGNVLGYIMLYGIGYIMLMGIGFFYGLAMDLTSAAQDFSLGVFMRGFLSFVPNITIGYLVIAVALQIKLYFKEKGKQSPEGVMPAQNTDDSLAMLKALMDNGILTQEEFEQKKEKLQLQ